MIESLAKIRYDHPFGKCELNLIKSDEVYGVTVTTYDEFLHLPHAPIRTFATGDSIFEACCELVEVRSMSFRIHFTDESLIESSKQCLERDVELMKFELHRKSTKLFIPNSEIEKLYKEVT